MHALEPLGVSYGPGLRYVLITAGCTMRCLHCSNPDKWMIRDAQRCATEEVVRNIGRYAAIYRRTGGMTVSGGEPLLQADFVGEVFRQTKDRYGLHTALHTNGSNSGLLPDSWFDPIDLVLLDVKHMDSSKHRNLTGTDVQPTLDFARRLSVMGKPAWIRHVLIPEYTDDLLDVERLADFVSALGNVERVEILPFRKSDEGQEPGQANHLQDTPAVSKALLDRVRKQFECRSIPVVA